jgi:hypothetical protein
LLAISTFEMNKTWFLIGSFLALTVTSAQTLEPRTLMTNRGVTLLEDRLSVTSDGWKIGKGAWTFADGGLNGKELPADKHAATYRRMLEFQDGVIQFEFKLDGAKLLTFSLNDAEGHVARVLVDAKGFQARKDDHDHAGPDKSLQFNRVDATISAGRWYTMLIEIRGSEMLARLVTDDALSLERPLVSFGGHELIASPKSNIGFTVQGASASFRNLRVQQALENDTWADTKRQLEATRTR